MNSMAGCEIMVAMITIFVGMATAMPLVSRPSFGTIFAHTTEIKNYGAQWFVHLHVETLPDNLMPDSNRKSLSDMRLCFIPSSEINSTNQRSLRHCGLPNGLTKVRPTA